MRLCEHCLCGIESHEGTIPMKIHVYIDDAEYNENFEKESTCEWCEESGFTELWLTGKDAKAEIKKNPYAYADI